MANLAIAKQHHKLAGLALVAGNHKKAAHHLGHAMNALRSNAPTGMAPATPMPDEPDDPTVQPPPKANLRSILARFKQAPR